jgi:CRP/FNR family transcriptional regulator
MEVADHPLFGGTDAARIAGLLGEARVESHEKGALLAGPGVARPDLILVLQGMLQAYDITAGGARILFELIDAGGFDAVLAILGVRPHFTEAASRVRVAVLHTSTLEKLIAREPAFATNLIRALALRTARRERQLAAMTLKSPSKRIARQLLALAAAVGKEEDGFIRLRIRLTHQQIADMLGMRRETATIHLHDLVATGALELGPDGMRFSRRRLQEIVADSGGR